MKEKILIAISDKNLLNVLVDRLDQSGYFTETVENGEDVINKLKEYQPELLLLDTVLPNRNGYDILTEKSFDKDITKIPVILISNSGEPIKMKQVPGTPTIKDYVIKIHVDPKEVINKIEKVFGRAENIENNQNKMDSITKGKVLWVEDDKLISNILTKKLESSGYTVLRADGKDQTFNILEKEIPDIIIMDIILPNMNGLDIVEKIKMRQPLKHIPIIVLSNLNKQSDIDKAISLGINKYMVKASSSLDEIVKQVKSLISH